MRPSALFDVWNERGVMVARLWIDANFNGKKPGDLVQALESHLEAGGRPDVVIDLNHQVIDWNETIGGVLRVRKLVGQQQGRMVFCHLVSETYELLHITRIDKLFRFEKDLSSALAFLNPAEEDRRQGPLIPFWFPDL